MTRITSWGISLGASVLWAVASLWLYRERTQPGRELGLSGSLPVYLWSFYLAAGLAMGAVHRPFGIQLAAGWRILGLAVALAGAILALWGMFEFPSLARVSALEESRLVTSGVYARERHPQHAGLLAAAFGLALAFQTAVGLLVGVVFLLWSLVQIRLEDRRLIILFGDEARCYIAAVPHYVPRLTTRHAERGQ